MSFVVNLIINCVSMRKEEEYQKAWESALRLLNYRERSVKELIDRLAAKRFSPEVISAIVEKLRKLELLDDEKFARLWVRSRWQFKPRSAWLIARELKEKGIEAGVVRNVIAQEMPPEREKTAARELAERRMHYYRNEEPAAARRKLFAYLARRGFPPDLIWECVNEVLLQADEQY